jgi:predicted alpha/beta superfamily hydrolase
MLVAIGYDGASRRAHDYVPVHAQGDGHSAGGAPAFRRFLLNDVRAAIATRWPVDTARQTLMGHSLGGLFVLTTMFEAPHAFQTWVASSPSVWWHAGYLLTAAQRFAKDGVRPAVGIRVLLSAAEYEQALAPAEHQLPESERNTLLQTRASRAMVEGNRALAHVLAGVAGLSVNFRFLTGETHRSAWLCAAAYALHEPL